MADIFISYARADRAVVEKFANAFESEGYSVWWDHRIEAGSDFSKDIERELNAAKIVIVCWSKAANESPWVKDEASAAREQGKLIPVHLDAERPPMGFRHFQAIDMSGWRGDAGAPSFVELSNAITSRLTGEAPAALQPIKTSSRGHIPPKTLIVAITSLVALLIVGLFVLRNSDDTPDNTIAANETGIDRSKSIAVLPFDDFSADDNEWFADGLTEEILNSLARTPDLLVASRTSSFAYKDTKEEIPTVAENLGVAHVLEGSVRRAGERLRITAQLIRAEDGFHLWSETYDRTSDDVITIQEDIAISIARALKTAMDPKALAEMVSAGTRSVDAYEAYLEGLATSGRARATAQEQLQKTAYEAYERARQIDPNFTEAHAEAANFWLQSLAVIQEYPDITVTPEEALQNLLERIDRAITHETDDAIRSRYHFIKASALGRLTNAAAYLQAYIDKHPNDIISRDLLATYYLYLGQHDKVLAVNRETEMIARDDLDNLPSIIPEYIFAGAMPDAVRLSRRLLALNPGAYTFYQAQRAFLWDGAIEEAKEAAVQYLRVNPPDDPESYLVAARDACAAGDRTRAERAAVELAAKYPDADGLRWLVLQLLGRKEEANRLLAPLDRPNPPYQISSFLVYPYFDASAFPNISAVLEREGVDRPPPVEIPFACPPADETQNAERSVAVLPFTDLSAAGDQQYFADGIAWEILNVLNRTEGLKVAAQTGSFQYRDNTASPAAIGSALNVAHLLTGSVRKQGGRLRITAQLIDVRDGAQMWSENFDRTGADVFEIQEDIATAVAEEFLGTISVDALPDDRFSGTNNPEAHNHYLRGLSIYTERGNGTFSEDHYKSAADATRIAIDLDPDFSNAKGLLALILAADVQFDFDPPPEVAEAAVERALESDPNNALAFMAHSIVKRSRRDFLGALAEAERAVAAAPENGEALHHLGGMRTLVGDCEGGAKSGAKAWRLDPYKVVYAQYYGGELHCLGRYEEADRIYREGMDLNPTGFGIPLLRIDTLLALGLIEVAFEEMEKLEAKLDAIEDDKHPFLQTYYEYKCRFLAIAGEKDQGRELYNTISNWTSPAYRVAALVALGDLDEAISVLEAWDDGTGATALIWLARVAAPVHPELRNDPRYVAWLEENGLTP